MANRIAELSSSFTIHGLNWVLSGRIPTKIFWGLSMLCVLACAFYATYGYINRYLKYKVAIETEYEEGSSITLPTMVFCLSSSLFHVKSCYKNTSYYDFSSCKTGNMVKNKLYFYNKNARSYRSGKYLGYGCHAIIFNDTFSLSDIHAEFHLTSPSDDTLKISLLSPKEVQSSEHDISVLPLFSRGLLRIRDWRSQYPRNTNTY